MAQLDYLRFLVATEADPALKAALRRDSRGLRTLGDLAGWAAGHGFRFAEHDIPLSGAPAMSATAAQPAARRTA